MQMKLIALAVASACRQIGHEWRMAQFQKKVETGELKEVASAPDGIKFNQP